MNFDAYVSVDQELAMYGVLCVEAMCGELGSGSSVQEVQGGSGDDDKPKPVPSFTESLNALETMRAFVYAHDITEIDQANILSTESLLFSLKREGATKQMKINDS
jgi:hypothetical protein